MGLFSSIGNIIANPVGSLNSAILGDSFSGKPQQDEANAMAMKSWHMANDYNHPINQMARLKAAGLNPLLVYGSGSVSGNTTSAPNLVGGTTKTGLETLYDVGSKALGALQGKANLDNTIAAAGASRAAAVSSGAQAANLNAQASLTETRNKFEQQSLIADIDYKQALADKTRAEASMAQGEARLLGDVGGTKGASALAQGGSKVAKFVKTVFGK